MLALSHSLSDICRSHECEFKVDEGFSVKTVLVHFHSSPGKKADSSFKRAELKNVPSQTVLGNQGTSNRINSSSLSPYSQTCKKFTDRGMFGSLAAMTAALK